MLIFSLRKDVRAPKCVGIRLGHPVYEEEITDFVDFNKGWGLNIMVAIRSLGTASLTIGALSLLLGTNAPALANAKAAADVFPRSATAQTSVALAEDKYVLKPSQRFEHIHYEQAHRAHLLQAYEEQAELQQAERARAQLLQALLEGAPRYSESPVAVVDTYLEPLTSVANSAPIMPADGTYLYGQQPVPEQLATAYFVFEARSGDITGAFFMPSSSFDCVQGHIEGGEIVLTVTDSYSQDNYQYALALEMPAADIAQQWGIVNLPPNISGFYSLPVRDSDRAVLATCQANYI